MLHGKGRQYPYIIHGSEYRIIKKGRGENMGAVIRVNGREVPETLAIVDTLNGSVTLESILTEETFLDMEKVHAEVNIFGDIQLAD